MVVNIVVQPSLVLLRTITIFGGTGGGFDERGPSPSSLRRFWTNIRSAIDPMTHRAPTTQITMITATESPCADEDDP